MLGSVSAAAAVLATALAVPFVPQNKDTCGAAALAMVLRYWGVAASHDAIAGELMTKELHGIPGSRLADLARGRGLIATAYAGDLGHLRNFVGKGRPLIVAWGLGRGRFHNVVVVGFEEDGAVLVNDPARGAGRAVPAAEFEERWAAAGHWTLLVMPAPPSLEEGLAASREGRLDDAQRLLEQAAAEAPGYEALVALGVARARLGRAREAREALDRALALDPRRPEALVESGGLHFLERQYEAAAAEFGRALAIREDAYARRMRASARHLAGRTDEALDDWNRLGEPRVAGVEVSGLRHTRPQLVQRELAFHEGEILTRRQLRESRLRLREIGVFDRVRLQPVPKGDGTADVQAALVERHGFGSPFALGVRLGADVFRQQVRLAYENVAGTGLGLGVLGKWQNTQPRIAMSVAWPRPFGLPFHLRIEAERSRPQYELDGTFRLRSRGLEARVRRVLGPRTVGETGVLTRDRTFSSSRPDAPPGRMTGLIARIEHRLVDRRRQRLEAFGEGFRAIDLLGSDVSATRGFLGVRYLGLVSGSDIDAPLPGSSLAARLVAGNGSRVPLDLMFTPGAASEMVWPLRAHRQKRNGVLGSAPIGSKMTLLNIEWRQRLWRASGIDIGIVAIYDGLDMAETAQGIDRTLHDAGLGWRMVSGPLVLRIDYCHSLTGDHRAAWTAGLGHAF
jgi:hypothetical protein